MQEKSQTNGKRHGGSLEERWGRRGGAGETGQMENAWALGEELERSGMGAGYVSCYCKGRSKISTSC